MFYFKNFIFFANINLMTSLVNILIGPVVDLFCSYNQFLGSEDALMLSLTSKRIYSRLKEIPSFIFLILGQVMIHQINQKPFLDIELSTLLNGINYPMIRKDNLFGDIRKLVLYVTRKPSLLLKEKIKLSEEGDVVIYIKKHSLAKNITLHQIESFEYLVFPNANLIKHEKWILFGELEIVKKKVDCLLEYLNNFVNGYIHTIHHL